MHELGLQCCLAAAKAEEGFACTCWSKSLMAGSRSKPKTAKQKELQTKTARCRQQGELEGQVKGRLKGNCNRQNVKGTRADLLSRVRERHTCNREGGSGKTTLPMGPLLHPLVLHHLRTYLPIAKATVDLIC